jgi:hypothetical protein
MGVGERDRGGEFAGLPDPLQPGELAAAVEPVRPGEDRFGPDAGMRHDDGHSGVDSRRSGLVEGDVTDANAGDVGDGVARAGRVSAHGDAEVSGSHAISNEVRGSSFFP